MLKCCNCGIETHSGVKTANGFMCLRDFENPYIWVTARIQCDYVLGKIKLDLRKNGYVKKGSENAVSQFAMTKRTKLRMQIDFDKFTQKQSVLVW